MLDRTDGMKELAYAIFPSEAAAKAAMTALSGKPLREGGPPMEFVNELPTQPAVSDLQTPTNNALRVVGLGPRTTDARFRDFFKSAPGLRNCMARKSTCVVLLPTNLSSSRRALVRPVVRVRIPLLRLGG